MNAEKTSSQDPHSISIGMLTFHSTKLLRASRKEKIKKGKETIDRGIITKWLNLPEPEAPKIFLITHDREVTGILPNDELEEVIINGEHPEQKVKVGLEIPLEERKAD